MHVTTRCPACSSLFRGPIDQLKAFNGWVRCGACAQVFDAMQQVPIEREMPGTAPPATPPGACAEPVAEPSVGTEPASTDHHAAVAAGESERHPLMDGSIPVLADPAAPHPAMGPPLSSTTAFAFDDALSEPGFVRRARRRAFWRSPGMRAALGLLCLLLAFLLLAQWAVQERDPLAASEPALAPWLAQACVSLGCVIAPVRRIEAVVIDSTALVRRLDGVYAFDIVLKNTASIPLAMPALELTLTQPGDAVLARRVFLPSELPGAPALLPAQASVALNLRLSLVVDQASSMAGYRAMVFYP